MIFVVTSGKGENEEEDSGDEAGGAGWSWTKKGLLFLFNEHGLHSTCKGGDPD